MDELLERLDTLSDEVSRFWAVSAKRQKWARRIIAIFFGAGGAALAGWAQFQAPDTPALYRTLGVVGVLAVLVAAFWGVFVDEDKAEALNTANESIRECDRFLVREEDYKGAVSELLEKQRRLTALHQAVMLMREAAEQAFRDRASVDASIANLLRIAAFQLKSAIAIEPGESWTISVFRAEQTNGCPQLVCIATDRYDQKEPSQVRRWPSGVGWGGAALARDTDIIIPDLSSPDLGTSNNLADRFALPQDTALYRSVAAVPIRVQDQTMTWGVVVATSGAADRFTNDVDDPGYLAPDVVRALAGMIALLVSGRARSGSVPPAAARRRRRP